MPGERRPGEAEAEDGQSPWMLQLMLQAEEQPSLCPAECSGLGCLVTRVM